MAACTGSYEVCEYLLKKGADVNKTDCEGSSPLHDICAFDFVDLIALFIEHGACVNHQSSCGETPLFCAAQNHQSSAIRKLFQHNADVNTANCHGVSALFESASSGCIHTTWTLLDIGAELISIESESFVNSIITKSIYENIEYTELLQLLLLCGFRAQPEWLINLRKNSVFMQQCSIVKLLEDNLSVVKSLQARCILEIRKSIAKPISIEVRRLGLPVKLQDQICFREYE